MLGKVDDWLSGGPHGCTMVLLAVCHVVLTYFTVNGSGKTIFGIMYVNLVLRSAGLRSTRRMWDTNMGSEQNSYRSPKYL